jgi:hypothetical protein
MFLNINLFLNVRNKLHKGEGVMNKRHVFCVGLVLLAAMVLLGAPMAAMATHPNVPLLDASGVQVTATTPYSPKMTCSTANACHISGGTFNSVTYTGQQLIDMHNYGSGLKSSTHVQGALGQDNKVYWQAYQNKSFAHGVSVGRHMNQGRNEDYSNADRAAVGDPFFTSSLGMWGKY